MTSLRGAVPGTAKLCRCGSAARPAAERRLRQLPQLGHRDRHRRRQARRCRERSAASRMPAGLPAPCLLVRLQRSSLAESILMRAVQGLAGDDTRRPARGLPRCSREIGNARRPHALDLFARKAGRSATSATSASAAGKFRLRLLVEMVVASREVPVLSSRRSARLLQPAACAIARGRALIEHVAVKLASPGLSSGFASLPLRTTRLADTTGTPPVCGSAITVKPFGSSNDCGTGTLTARAAAPAGCFARHGSSALIETV